MKPLLSPRELARAIGVSESSLKRWADDGVIRAARTAGGHRRIPIAEAVRFIRETRAALIHPEILGLPEVASVLTDALTGDDDAQRLFQYLMDGRARQARGLLLSLYLAGNSIASIFDGPVRSAMTRIGEIWKDNDDGIFLEHRATEICTQAVRQLQATIEASDDAPCAVGGAPPGDSSGLPSLAAATVLKGEGFQAVNLGPQTPLDTLLRAADHHHAWLVWLSITHANERDKLERALFDLAQQLRPRSVRLVIGGREAKSLTEPPGEHVHVGGSMAELAAFAKGLLLARQERATDSANGRHG